MYQQKIKELSEKRGQITEQQRSILDEVEKRGSEMTAEEADKYDKLDNEFRNLERDLVRFQDQEKRGQEKALEEHTKTEQRGKEEEEKAYAKAFDQYLRFGAANLTPEQRSILATGQKKLTDEQRAQSTTPAAGGYTIPRGFSGEIEKMMKDYGGTLEFGRFYPTATGNIIDWPTNDDTANKSKNSPENTDRTTGTTDLTFGSVAIGAYGRDSGFIRVSNELLQDSDFDMNAFIMEAISERIGRGYNTDLTTGSGSSAPQGVAVGAGTVAAANAATIVADDILNLIHGVNQAYRRSPKARLMMADTTLLALRKLKDTTGQYIWQMGDITKGVPGTIWGVPYIINDDMAAIGTGNKSVAYGDGSKFIIRQAGQIVIVRAAERFIDFNQTGFMAFVRYDSKVLNSSAVKVLTHP